MNLEMFLKEMADLCTKFEEANGNDSSSVIGCFVQITKEKSLNTLYEYNGATMMECGENINVLKFDKR